MADTCTEEPFVPTIRPDAEQLSGIGYLGSVGQAGRWFVETLAEDEDWVHEMQRKWDWEGDRLVAKLFWEGGADLTEIQDTINIFRYCVQIRGVTKGELVLWSEEDQWPSRGDQP